MRKELEPDQAQDEEDEDAELEDPEDHPGGVGTGEGVDERPLELLLDAGGCVAVVVEELPLTRVEHQAADHQVDAGKGRPVGHPVEDRSLSDDRERLLVLRCIHLTAPSRGQGGASSIPPAVERDNSRGLDEPDLADSFPFVVDHRHHTYDLKPPSVTGEEPVADAPAAPARLEYSR